MSPEPVSKSEGKSVEKEAEDDWGMDLFAELEAREKSRDADLADLMAETAKEIQKSAL